MEGIIREAKQKDISYICDIHNQGIIDKIATLDTTKHSLNYQKKWFEKHKSPFGIWVFEQHDRIIGWVSLNIFNSRPGYKFVADLSVYVERSSRGKGVGSKLLDFVVKKARKNDFHKIVISAFPFNKQGITLYEKFGFRKVGIYKEQGKLDGKWVDVVIMEKIL